MARPVPCKDYVRTPEGLWKLQGDEVSEELKKKLDNLRIPPAWKNVVVAKDPSAKVVAVGQDVAGRWQYKYSQKFIERQAELKFNRIKSFSRDISAMRRQIEHDIVAGDARAHLLRLEDKTAIRVGSLRDVKAKVQAYGLTTLKNEHVIIEGNKIILDFVAKKGIPAHYELTDKVLASFLSERKAATAVGEYLFPDVNGRILNKYIRQLAKKSYSIKDFRTYHATRIALTELRQYSGAVLSNAERKKIIKEVSEKVSKFLHNTPAMARNSYIDPSVWETIGGLDKAGFTTKQIVKRLRGVKGALEASLLETAEAKGLGFKEVTDFLLFLGNSLKDEAVLEEPSRDVIEQAQSSMETLERMELLNIERKFVYAKAKQLFTGKQVKMIEKMLRII